MNNNDQVIKFFNTIEDLENYRNKFTIQDLSNEEADELMEKLNG